MNEKTFFKTSDGTKLNGFLEKNKLNRNVCVIMCHGIRSNSNERGNFTELCKILNSINIDSFRFDFRGHGESSVDFIEVSVTSMINDLEAAVEFVQKLGYSKILLLGASMGASILPLIDYGKYTNIVGLIFWYPITMYEKTNIFTEGSINEALEKGYIEKINKSGRVCRLSRKLMIEVKKYKPLEKLESNVLAKLFVHGTKDEVSFLENSTDASQCSLNSKVVVIEDGTHGFFDNREHFKIALNQTINFINNYS